MSLDYNRTLAEVFVEAFQTYPDSPAFTCMDHTLGYRQLDDLTQRFAAYLQHCTQLQPGDRIARSEEHTSELQSRENLVCRLLLEKKKKKKIRIIIHVYTYIHEY